VFETSDFHTTALSQAQPLEHEGHFQPDNSSTSPINKPWCDTDMKLAILPFSNVAGKLKTHIDGLYAGGNTASDLGMKWGTAMLDPGTQPVLSALAAEGRVDPVLIGRPASWSDPDTLKIVVLMTDGDNTTQYDIKDQYKRGLSNIWYDSGAKRWYQYIPNYNRYYTSYNTSWSWSTYSGSIPPTAERLTWPQVWGKYAIHHFSRNFYDDISSSLESFWKYEPYETAANDNLADTRLAANCSAAKNKKIIVFTIGFEAPNWAKTMMRNCATSPAHYYDVQGIQISDAFNAIASTIQRLKLTQ
jgi:hypothetical protein